MRGFAIVLLLLSHPAWADPQQLAAAAEKSGEPADFVACGQAFFELYNQDPAAPGADEVLFDAASCFERGRSVTAALASYGMVVKSMPNSKLASSALARSGMLYEQIAWFDRAADRYEELAHKFAGDKEAIDLLLRAIQLRAALGNAAKQIDDTNYLIKTYGAKDRARAAKAELALLPVMSDDKAIALLQTFLRGSAVDVDDAIRAHVELGDRLRAKACPVTPIDGLCVKFVVEDRPHCGTGTMRLLSFPRSDRDAIGHYEQAIKLYESGPHPDSRHTAAMARLALADDTLETMLAVGFPANLDLASAHAASMKRFTAWLDDEQKLGETATRAYERILGERDGSSSVAAAARIGQTAEGFWRTMMMGEIPKSLRAKAPRDAYCKALDTASQPIKLRATEAFSACAAKANELDTAHEWAEVCWREGELGTLKEVRGTVRDTPPLAVEMLDSRPI